VDAIEPVWLFGAIVLACGIFFGMLITRLLTPSTAEIDQLKTDLERERAEMKSYKESVNSHFNKTSDLFKELNQDYVRVYRHLAEGAQALSDTPEFTQVLAQPQDSVLISVESGADEAVVVADAAATANSSESRQQDSLQTESPEAEASAADEPSADVPQQADELSTAEVVAPSDYARDDGGDDRVAAQSGGRDNEGSDAADKAAEQDTDTEEKPAAAVTVDEAAADSPSTPAPESAGQTAVDEDKAKLPGKAGADVKPV